VGLVVLSMAASFFKEFDKDVPVKAWIDPIDQVQAAWFKKGEVVFPVEPNAIDVSRRGVGGAGAGGGRWRLRPAKGGAALSAGGAADPDSHPPARRRAAIPAAGCAAPPFCSAHWRCL
jgi:hypothetical protein